MIAWHHEPVRPIEPGHIGMTSYLGPLPAGDVDTTAGFPRRGPQAYLVAHGREVAPLRTHFHRVDQFQLVDRGAGRLGREAVTAGSVHYADGWTPYGPLGPEAVEGLGYVTLRARAETGLYAMPDRRDRLRAALAEGPRSAAERRSLTFELRPPGPAAGWVDVQRDPDGLRVAHRAVDAGAPLAVGEVAGAGAFLAILGADGAGSAPVWPAGSVAWCPAGAPGPSDEAPHRLHLALLQLPDEPPEPSRVAERVAP